MPEETLTTLYQYGVSVGGQRLEENILSSLQQIVVDQALFLPDMCEVTFLDEDLKKVDSTTFSHGQELVVSVGSNDIETELFRGEITAIEPRFGAEMRGEFVIRGYDKSWRAYRESITKGWVDTKDSDIVTAFANNMGLSPEAQSTSEVFKHLYQDAQSDMAYVLERADRLGYQIQVVDGKLKFEKPGTSAGEVTLKWGEDLVSFEPRLTVAEQVDEVTVKGWDPAKKEAIIGKASSSTTHPSINVGGSGGAVAKSKIGAAGLVIVDQPVNSQADATAVAQGHLDRLNGRFVQAEGKFRNHPEIRAGMRVKLEKLGDKFSGTYFLTSTTHVYNQTEGFTTSFKVLGGHTDTFAELIGNQEPLRRWSGVYPAIVTNNQSSEGDWGMVKVKYPWMDEGIESYWARIASPGAGKERGLYLMPEIDDEVLVAFEHGDFNRPYILGGLWNGKDAPSEGVSTILDSDKVGRRIWKSRLGHFIVLSDKSGEEKVEIQTQNGITVLLDDKNKEIKITHATASKGPVTLTVDSAGSTTLQGGQDITFKAAGNMVLKADGNINIEAMGNLDMKATGNATLKATGMLTTDATGNATHQATGMMTVKSSAIMTIQGSLVKIN